MTPGEIISHLLILLLAELTRSELLNICWRETDSDFIGTLHCGHVSQVADISSKRETGVRSKVECAVNCYSSNTCLTAVYNNAKGCTLTARTFQQLNVLNSSSQLIGCPADDIIEVRSTDLNVSCPSPCIGYSICAAHCTDLNQTKGCMDVTQQQNNDQPLCEFKPPIRSKEYYLQGLLLSYMSDSDSNSKVAFRLDFVKEHSWTTLRVKWRGSLSQAYGPRRDIIDGWRIKFNNNDCSSPGPIDIRFYQRGKNVINRRSTGFQSICYDLPAGKVEIAMRGWMKYSGTYWAVGRKTNGSRIYVEELSQVALTANPTVSNCSSLSIFNTRQHTYKGGSYFNGTVKGFDYMKVADNTGLKINVNTKLRVKMEAFPQGVCALFSIKIDGMECEPTPIGVVISSNNSMDVAYESRFTEFQGHCYGVASGLHQISLHVSTCDNGVYNMEASTGYPEEYSWILVEEYRHSSNIMAALAVDDESIYRIPQLNIMTWGLSNPNVKTVGEQTAWEVTNYVKIYKDSGLQILLSGTGAATGSSNDLCCRYYFKINGMECVSPGPIDGIVHVPGAVEFHSAFMIEGICEDVRTGPVNITLWSGKCLGSTPVNRCTLGYKGFVHMMVAETFVEREIVQFD